MTGGARKGAGRPLGSGKGRGPSVPARVPIDRYKEFLAFRDEGKTYAAGFAAGQERMRERAAALAVEAPKTWRYSGKRQRFDVDQMEFQRRTTGRLIEEDIRSLTIEDPA